MGEIKYELEGFLMIREGGRTEYHLTDEQGRRVLLVDPSSRGIPLDRFFNGSKVTIQITPGPIAPTARQE